MKVKPTGRRGPLTIGLFFIGFALLAAILLSTGTKSAASPTLYVIIIGGLFVGVPGALGIGIAFENLRGRRDRSEKRRRRQI